MYSPEVQGVALSDLSYCKQVGQSCQEIANADPGASQAEIHTVGGSIHPLMKFDISKSLFQELLLRWDFGEETLFTAS